MSTSQYATTVADRLTDAAIDRLTLPHLPALGADVPEPVAIRTARLLLCNQRPDAIDHLVEAIGVSPATAYTRTAHLLASLAEDGHHELTTLARNLIGGCTWDDTAEALHQYTDKATTEREQAALRQRAARARHLGTALPEVGSYEERLAELLERDEPTDQLQLLAAEGIYRRTTRTADALADKVTAIAQTLRYTRRVEGGEDSTDASAHSTLYATCLHATTDWVSLLA